MVIIVIICCTPVLFTHKTASFTPTDTINKMELSDNQTKCNNKERCGCQVICGAPIAVMNTIMIGF